MKLVIILASLIVAAFDLPQKTAENPKFVKATVDPNYDARKKGEDNDEIFKFLQEFNEKEGKLNNIYTIASWNYNTNLTDENADIELKANKELEQYNAEAFKTVQGLDLRSIEDSPELNRQLKKIGKKSLPEDEADELNTVIQKMGKIYGASKICVDEEETSCYNLEPELSNIMADSTNYTERFNVWKEWRKVVGSQIQPLYTRYVALKNKLAVLRGYNDYGEEWRDAYEMDDFEGEVMNIYEEMQPLYKELHAFIRRKLWRVYGEKHIDIKGPIPAHLLSDMWGRFWNNLNKIVEPFPGKAGIDPSENMKKLNYTALRMFQEADNFYASMGLLRVPDAFWKNSMLVKPTDGRDVVCHATAWDFYDGEDFRIKMCTRDFSFEDLSTIYHEMGHIQYFMQYKDQPQVFREGANDGFHEAIGELMGMISANPKYLHKVGLLDNLVENEEVDINFLMSQALITISTLPFHLVNDLWSWGVFSGKFKEADWNKEFWKLKVDMLGVVPPVERKEEDVFLDPPTLFHINQDFNMIRYFARTILQFQFAEKLCEISGHTGPLHRCDFSGSEEAGEKLAQLLRLGSSKPWQDALEALTGTRSMSAKAIIKFFEPLHEYLKKENKKNGEIVGWDYGLAWFYD